jgi:UDP-N-acetylglucosamine transferase subunit ALG13
VILVTVGTNEAPFDRLLRAVAALATDEDIFVQHGASAVKSPAATCIDFLPFDELVAHVRKARVVVTHGGVGSIMVALSQGKRPIVVPRLRRFQEAVDDHQLPFARRLAEQGLVALVEHESELASAIGDQQEIAALTSSARTSLVGDLAVYLRRLVDGDDSGREPKRDYSR